MQSLMPNDRTRVLIVRQCGDGGPQSEVPFPALSSDFDVVATDSIAKALNELERHEFHVALLVCANGRKHADSVHRVRGLYPRLPLVAVVSHETLDEVRAGLVDDAQDFLVADGMSPAAVEWTIHNAVRRTNRMLDLEQLAREIDHVDDGIRWARRKIRRQHRLAEKLATCIGHDFRASLTVVREHASPVTDGLCGPVTDDQAELLQTACDRVDDLCGMLHDVEYFGKLCAGGGRSRHRVCRVRDIVRSAMGKLAARAAASGQACTSEYDESASMIFCDPEMAAH